MAANHVGHGVFRFSDLPESVRRRIWNAADDTRLVGVAPRRDRNAPRKQSILTRLCKESRRVFSIHAFRLYDSGFPFVLIGSKETPDWVYINPHRDVLYLGYETICNEWSLIEPPNSHSLIAFLKRCWLHDINVPISVGYTSFEFDPTMPAVEIDVTCLAYINLERVTITSENVAPSIVEELDGYTDFKFVYHVKTNTVLVSQGTIPEDAIMAEHHQLRLSGDHIFKVEVLFDRQPDLLHDTTEWQAINNDETDASVFDKASEPLQFVWTFAAEYLLKRLVR
ncbi:hypothetical protein CKAH01_00345 [Colletotrichum kahawae]|uniref:2EXR domain-containing protein n=1 Tax=Colletotrichum kahawae TaxID=34407 RepID=A0AAE0DET3_COLKA|nr:hypothetical protein CKAH01_00345 [Colletotrichum kahawae]